MSAKQQLDQRLAFMRFDHKSRSALKAAKAVIDVEIHSALDGFYDQVRATPETRQMFASRAQMDGAQARQADHWRKLATAEYGEDYARDVQKVGRAHVRVGLEPRWYIGGYALVAEQLIRAVLAKRPKGLFAGKDDGETAEQIVALMKATFLDMDLAISSYLDIIQDERDRLEALVRVDDRRWDLRLKDGSLIQLPAIDEESALIQLDQLDQRQRILDLGFARIDLRDPEMVAVRPRDAVLPGQPVAGGA
jgi:methyl-accepting chemotaxis protein